jgi:hypothetical protein
MWTAHTADGSACIEKGKTGGGEALIGVQVSVTLAITPQHMARAADIAEPQLQRA